MFKSIVGTPRVSYRQRDYPIPTSIAPRVVRHQFELALLYIDWDREEGALRVLQGASHLHVLVASDIPTQARIHELIASLGG
jgi:hypothetical protein